MYDGKDRMVNDWYQTLQKPPLTPPSWVFGPVWTVLYVMIALSLVLFVKNDRGGAGVFLYLILGLHLLSNIAWTGLFFGLEAPGWALLDILILDATLIFLVSRFWEISRVSSLLLWPYLIWVCFATYLNAGFLYLNRSA